MKEFFFEKLQKAINRFLAFDPESEVRLQALQGKSVTLELNLALQEHLSIPLHFTNKSIEILPNLPESPDLVIKGTPLSLLGMSLAKDKRSHFFGDNVVIEGNLELGQQVTDLFEQLEIDWEESLSHWVGDVPAHQVGLAVKGIKDFTKRFHNAMTRNINEYVHEEIDLFPAKEALKDFFDDVDILRMDVDRIEARIEKLKRGDQ